MDCSGVGNSVYEECWYFKEEHYLFENEFGFDFSDDVSIRSDVIFNTVSMSPFGDSSIKEEPNIDTKLVTAVTRKRGSKFMRKAAASYPAKLALRPKATFTGVRTMQPNMSRRTRDAALYVFPSFDRCDSLLFFPSTFARHMNSGDVPSISKMLSSHFHKNVTVGSNKNNDKAGLNIDLFTQKMQVLEELQPDRIVCFRHHQVDENVIKAVGYMKFTKSRVISEAVALMYKGTCYTQCFKQSWHQHMRKKLKTEGHSDELTAHFMTLLDKGCDVVAYFRIDMELTIDSLSGKVTHFGISITTTGMEEVKYDVPVEKV